MADLPAVKIARLAEEIRGLRGRLEALEGERSEMEPDAVPKVVARLEALEARIAAVEELGARIVKIYEANKGKPLARMLGLK